MATWNALLRWLDRRSIGGEVATIDSFVKQHDSPELEQELDMLQRAVVGRQGSTPWQGRRLLTQLAKVRVTAHVSAKQLHHRTQGALPKLNPAREG